MLLNYNEFYFWLLQAIWEEAEILQQEKSAESQKESLVKPFH